MKRSLPWILLVISLFVNVGFVYGAWQAQQRADRLAHAADVQAQEVVERLELDSAQQQALERTRDALQKRRQADRDDGARQERQRAVLEALLEPDFDRAQLKDMLEVDSAQRLERWLDMSETVHAFLQQLNPDQQQAFLELTESDRGWLRALFFPRPDQAGD